ncbi:hypothetical protein N9A28_08130 [Sulfurimonas sp.]|nr:hypothetical protein [Sulfurimonas sp.]
MLKVSLSIVIAMLFSGCTLKIINVSGIPADKHNTYNVLYKANYDINCTFDGDPWINFKEGDGFLPLDMKSLNIVSIRGIHQHTLDKHAIGFNVGELDRSSLYVLIYPDGNFVSETNTAVMQDPIRGNGFISLYLECPSQQEVAPFTLVENQ